MKKLIMAGLAMACAVAYCDAAKTSKDSKDSKEISAAAAAKTAAQAERRAMRMIKNAVSLLQEREEDRAINMLEAVPRMYPQSQARFKAHLELGRHCLSKRDFDRALAELKKACESKEEEVCAEANFLTGELYLAKNQPGEAAMVFRRVSQDFPTSDFANDAFFKIGQIHFHAGRWARATEAFEMVGTAVPLSVKTNAVVLVEAGQRIFVHVTDKDLAVLALMGEKTKVKLIGSGGDSETVELASFGKGDGDFIASCNTTLVPSQVNDGVLTVRGNDPIKVEYIDNNTLNGDINIVRKADAHTASSATVAFLDGAMRQKVNGVFVDQPAFIRLRDLDLDLTDGVDKATVHVKSTYRERPEPAPGETVAPPPAPDAPWLTRYEMDVVLSETGPRTGIFAGRIVVRLLPADTNKIVKLPANEIYASAEDKVVVEYDDKRHLGGEGTANRSSSAIVLVGGSTEPKSIVAHSSEATIQAKKLLLEAKLLYKWAAIFKDVGLVDSAREKSDDGLQRISTVFDLSNRNTLDRTVIEEAYEARWNLFLVRDDLKNAVATCNALVKRFPDTVLADRAFMRIAMARREEKEHDAARNAIAVFKAILDLPNSQLKAEAQYRIAETLEMSAREAAAKSKARNAKPDFSSAMAAYQTCADAYPTSSFAGESYKKMVDYCISIKTFPRALEMIRRVLEDYPDAPWLDEMIVKWGVILHRQGDREGAIAKFRQVLEEYPSGKAAKQASQFIKRLED